VPAAVIIRRSFFIAAISFILYVALRSLVPAAPARRSAPVFAFVAAAEVHVVGMV
jgi:hypothetical protein